MKNTLKRLLSVVLSVVMVISMVPATVFEAVAATKGEQLQLWLTVPQDPTGNNDPNYIYASLDDALKAQRHDPNKTNTYDSLFELVNTLTFTDKDGNVVDVDTFTDNKAHLGYEGYTYVTKHAENEGRFDFVGYDVARSGEVKNFSTAAMEYIFVGWEKLEVDSDDIYSVDTVASSSRLGEALEIPAGTTIYIAQYMGYAKTYDLNFHHSATLGAENDPVAGMGREVDTGSRLLPAYWPTQIDDNTFEMYDAEGLHLAQYDIDVPAGHTFIGWYTTPWNADPQTTIGGNIDTNVFVADSSTEMPAGVLNLYAHYKPDTSTVTYEAYNPVTGALMDQFTMSGTVTYGQEISYDYQDTTTKLTPWEDFSTQAPTFAGWTCIGYKDASGNMIDATTVVDFTTDKTYEAVWSDDATNYFYVKVRLQKVDGTYDSTYDTKYAVQLPMTGYATDAAIVIDLSDASNAITEAIYNSFWDNSTLPGEGINDIYGYVAGYDLANADLHVGESDTTVNYSADGDYSVVYIDIPRKQFNLTIDNVATVSGNNVVAELNGNETPVVVGNVFFGTLINVNGNNVTLTANTVTTNVDISEFGYTLAWDPSDLIATSTAGEYMMPAVDTTLSATGTPTDVNFTVTVLYQNLKITSRDANGTTHVTILTQAQLEQLNKDYLAVYNAMAAELTYVGANPTEAELEAAYAKLNDTKNVGLINEMNNRLLAVKANYYPGDAISVEVVDEYAPVGSPINNSWQADFKVPIVVTTEPVSFGAMTGIEQYVVTYTDIAGNLMTIDYEDLNPYTLNGNYGFKAGASAGNYNVVENANGEPYSIELKYDRLSFDISPMIYFPGGQGTVGVYEPIPNMKHFEAYYGTPMTAILETKVEEAHLRFELAPNVGHEGYEPVLYTNIFNLHRKNADVVGLNSFTSPAKLMVITIGEYQIQEYTLVIEYFDYYGVAQEFSLPVEYKTALGGLLTDSYLDSVDSETGKKSFKWAGYEYSTTDRWLDANDAVVDMTTATMPAPAVDATPAEKAAFEYVLKLQYTPVEITLTYNENKPTEAIGSVTNMPADEVVNFTTTFPTVTNPTLEGYVFMGWTLTVNGVTYDINAGDPVDFLDATSTVYPIWEAYLNGNPVTIEAVWEEADVDVIINFYLNDLDGNRTTNWLSDDIATPMTQTVSVRVGSNIENSIISYIEQYDAEAEYFYAVREDYVVVSGSTVVRNVGEVVNVYFNRNEYTFTINSNVVANTATGYAYGATLDGAATTTVSFKYGADLSTYYSAIVADAKGYAVASWNTLGTWDEILDKADYATRTAPTVTDAAYGPKWSYTPVLVHIDPAYGSVEIYVNGEAYDESVILDPVAFYFAAGADIKLVAVEDANNEFLFWLDATSNKMLEPNIADLKFVASDDLSYKAVYCKVSGNTVNVYINSMDGQVIYSGYKTYDLLDDYAYAAFMAKANSYANGTYHAFDGTFTKAYETANAVIYYTNHNKTSTVNVSYADETGIVNETVSTETFVKLSTAATYNGEDFYGWYDTVEGVYISYSLEYKFYPKADTANIEAHYGALGVQNVSVSFDVVRTTDKLTIVVSPILASGCTVTSYGYYITKNAAATAEMYTTAALASPVAGDAVVIADANIETANRTTAVYMYRVVTITAASQSSEIAVMAYVTYTDNTTGNTYTVYSPVVVTTNP